MLVAGAVILAVALRRRDLEAFEPELEAGVGRRSGHGQAAALDGAKL